MTPDAIQAFGRGFKLGVEASRNAMRALLAETRALEIEIAQIRAELDQLHALALAEPQRPWSMH